MNSIIIAKAIGLLMLLLSATNITAQVRLPRLLSDGVILQRGTVLEIWGWATPGETVNVRLGNNYWETVTGNEGKWAISLPPQDAGGPHEMLFTASNKVTLKDIYFGDVWVLSGQSNMELPMRRVSWVYPGEIKNSNFPLIRQFRVPQEFNFHSPQQDFSSGNWVAAHPGTISEFSAVGWFFARHIQDRYSVPIGLILNAVGGSPAEAWMSEDALKQFPNHHAEMVRFRNQPMIDSITAADNKRIQGWHVLLNQTDPGLHHRRGHLGRQSKARGKWERINMPALWYEHPELASFNGSVWLRRTFTVPEHMVGEEGLIVLGCIVDADSVFVNGQFVGTTGFEFPPRRYKIPANLLVKGKNSVTARVIVQSGSGGFVPDKDYVVVVNNDTINLSGTWYYRKGSKMNPLAGQTFVRWKPGGLFNAMLAPIQSFAIKGVLWYQGESNTGRAVEYEQLMKTLIHDWRKGWNHSDLPFLYVQLANFMRASGTPTESNWARLRESQRALLAVPNTAMAVAIDIGEWNDIHPLNKKDVGLRLALAAERVAMGNKTVVYSGPLYQSHVIDGSRVIITFSNTGGGLVAKNGEPLKHFAIAGSDGNYQWANAKIEGNTVIVWNNNILAPASVRYAWADNPEGANLFNKEGLPASPFSTKGE